MNYITTNIRLPEELYMELKLQAARKRSSISALIREQIQTQTVEKEEKRAQDLIKAFDSLSKRIARHNKGINLTKAVIDMRCEQ